MTAEQRIDVDALLRGYEAVGRRDWVAATEIYHPAIEWVDPPVIPGGGTHTGIVEIRDSWRNWGESWESWSVEPLEHEVRGDKVLVRTRMRGVGRGSGIEVDVEYWQLWTFRDGKAIRQQGFARRDQAEHAIETGA